MKKLVFDLPTYVEETLKRDISKKDLLRHIKSSAYECHGKTREECNEMDYTIRLSWCKEIEVPLEFNGVELKVGQCFVLSEIQVGYDYWKIKSVHNDYFEADFYKQYGVLLKIGISKWYPRDIHKLIDEPKPTKVTIELTQEQLNKIKESGLL